MNTQSKIFVAGGDRGLLGSAIVRRLRAAGHTNILAPSRAELDLQNQAAVDAWFDIHRPEYVFMCAAKLNGITSRAWAETILWNLQIQTNVIDAARRNGCVKYLFPGSSCAYPKHSRLPITEDQMLAGYLEPTSEAYAVAKIAGIKTAENFRRQWGFDAISVMPCNLYGANDTYNEVDSHVMSDLILKFVIAADRQYPIVELWGDGSQRREFLYADDAADACVFCMHHYSDLAPINISSGYEITLRELADMLKQATGFQGDVVWDTTKPTGTLAKNLDITRITALGWKPQVDLEQGLALAIQWFQDNFDHRSI